MGIIGEKSHPSLRCLLHDSGWHDAIIMSTKFPEIQGGGSLILAWQIKGERMEIIELKDHPFFVGVQFHPEYLSRVLRPSPPYLGFVAACAGVLEQTVAAASS